MGNNVNPDRKRFRYLGVDRTNINSWSLTTVWKQKHLIRRNAVGISTLPFQKAGTLWCETHTLTVIKCANQLLAKLVYMRLRRVCKIVHRTVPLYRLKHTIAFIRNVPVRFLSSESNTYPKAPVPLGRIIFSRSFTIEKFSNREQSETNRNDENAMCDFLSEYLRMCCRLYEDSLRPFLDIFRTLFERSKIAVDC